MILFLCIIAGAEYGVCCADVDQLVKPGVCPIVGFNSSDLNDDVFNGTSMNSDNEIRCGASCEHDLQCPSTQKCCKSDICGQHCVQPNNLTSKG